MSNYAITTEFGPKDALAPNEPAKIIRGTEIGVEFTNIAEAIASKADLISPVFTGIPEVPTAALNDNSNKIASTAFVQQEINSAIAAGTEGLDGVSYISVDCFKRAAIAPDPPVGGSFNFSGLVLIAPPEWSIDIPSGTDPVYRSTAIASTVGATGTEDDSLTWSTPVLAFRNGADGSGTDTRSANGLLYYATSRSTAPVAPTDLDTNSYDFETSTFAVIKAGWDTKFEAPSMVSGAKYWAVEYYVEVNELNEQTVTIGTEPFIWMNFDGLVTFTNTQSAFDAGVTVINGGKITTGTITVDKISSGTSNITGDGSDIQFGLGSADTINGYQSAGYFNSDVYNKFGLGVTSYNALGIAAATYAYDSSAGGFFSSSNEDYNAYRTVALLGNGAYAGAFQYGQTSPTAKIRLATNGFAYYIDVGGVGGPFTGAHDGLLDNNEIINEGDILVDTGFSVNANISDAITKVSCSSTANQKGAIGVFNKYSDSSHVPAALSICVFDEVSGSSNFVINPEHEYLLQENKLVIINSIGEGLINVCGEGGSIEVGDLIVTSSIAGKGMKQADDIIRGYTVAKARESVTFNSPDEIKQIACIYVAG